MALRDSTPGRESCRNEAFGVNWQRSKQPNRYMVTVCFCFSLWTTVRMVDDAVVSPRSWTTTTTHHHHQRPFILHPSISNQSFIHSVLASSSSLPVLVNGEDANQGLPKRTIANSQTNNNNSTNYQVWMRLGMDCCPNPASPPFPFACLLLRNPRFCP